MTPPDPYGDDAATTRFLLERILRGSGIQPLLPSAASSSAADVDPAEREDAADPASGSVPSAQARVEDSFEASGEGPPPATGLHRPLEATASAPVSRLPDLLGPEGRVIIVANRLPVTAKRLGANWEYDESSGGLVSALRGAAQSLRSGAIIVNPWDIAKVAGAIKFALDMPAIDRENRHKHNYGIVSMHTAQDWAQNFLHELNDTAMKAPVRSSQSCAVLPIKEAAAQYAVLKNRLLILGFNETLTEPVHSTERRDTDQTEGIQLKLNPGLKRPLETLCDNENTTVIVVSGHGKSLLDKNFGEYKMWLAAENGMFLRRTGEPWTNTMSEHLEISCFDSVKKVFEYFRKRTPGSYHEERETSVVWNYKYADVQTGRSQAKDLLQHSGSYSLSNQSAEVVQGNRSIEVRPTGATKGKAVDEIIKELGSRNTMATPIDYVLCIGHFLAKDEDVYTLSSFDAQPGLKRKEKVWQAGYTSIKFDLKPENYFPCTVGREHTIARYTLEGTDDVVSLLQDLAAAAVNVGNQP